MMTLALLITAVGGAWATDGNSVYWNNQTWAGWADSETTHTVGDITITTSGIANGSYAYQATSSGEPLLMVADGTSTITFSSAGAPFKSINIFADIDSDPDISGWTCDGQNIEWSGTPSTSVTLSGCNFEVFEITFTFGSASSATPVPLTWDAATPNTATLTNGMPAGNVTVSVEYFPQAAFAMSTDATPVALAPKASTSARANTDDPLVEGGTVAGIVDGEAMLEEGQGTLLYHFSAKQLDADALEALTATDWTDKVPTADGLAEGTVYVYYYIKGADDLPGITPGAKFTFSDSDIQELAVTLAPEPTYNVEFAEGTNPEDPAEPIWTATPNTGVKKGQTVTVTYSGDRKVIGVKAEKKATKLTITIPATENAAALTLDVTGCTTWGQILDQNLTTLDYEGDGVYGQTSNCYILDGNNNRLYFNTPYDPTTNYHWGTQK